jgi:cellulose synthase/poly-beta-1,6-N-acetylglucosamine synthase-like glycosyltransferase
MPVTSSVLAAQVAVQPDPRAEPGADPAAVDWRLPSPPTDLERDGYLGPQSRWICLVSFASYLLIVLSIGYFVLRQPWACPLLLPLALSGVGTTVSLFTSSRRRRLDLPEHRRVVQDWQPERAPTVDVFLPSAGEDLAVLANTYRHVAALVGPTPLRVYVLDDSARPEVADLAASHGFDYLSRPDRGVFKKAGNLRHGFERSSGDVILVLDADFAPRPDLLAELCPYFDDERVAIVQSPQYFDATGAMNWLQRAAGATQVLFYRWVQPSRDRSDAAICVGTSALYRRSALERSGGFALIGHSEDVHTGVNLMRAGYAIRYVPTVVTKGLCPDALDQFLTQQYRWCTGSMSLLFSRSFHRIDLTVWQRLSYWSGFLYYITTAVNVFVMALPAILMGYVVPGRVSIANYVFVLLAMVGRQTVVPFITMERESLVGLSRIQTLYSFSHAVALYDVLRGRTDGWVATGVMQRSRTAVRVHRLARRWCLGVQLALWGAIAWYAPVFGLAPFSLMIAFALMNLYITYPIITGRVDLPLLADLPGVARQRLTGPVIHGRVVELGRRFHPRVLLTPADPHVVDLRVTEGLR